MILIITNRFDSHADFVIEKLWRKGIQFSRFNTDDYPTQNDASFSAGFGKQNSVTMKLHGQEVKAEQIKSVWYRRPMRCFVSPIINQEARKFATDECQAFCEGLWAVLSHALWVSYPARIREAQNKMLQLRLAEKLGFRTPRTLITSDPRRFLVFWEECNGEVIYKALGFNTTRSNEGRLQFAYTNKLDTGFLARSAEIALAPCLFQEYIPKKVELRITVVADRVFACEIHSQKSERAKIDWRHYDLENTPHLPCTLPAEVKEQCLELVKGLGLQFGAIDMIVTPGGEYVFVEINPNGQWLWIEQLTNLPISEALIELLTQQSKSR